MKAKSHLKCSSLTLRSRARDLQHLLWKNSISRISQLKLKNLHLHRMLKKKMMGLTKSSNLVLSYLHLTFLKVDKLVLSLCFSTPKVMNPVRLTSNLDKLEFQKDFSRIEKQLLVWILYLFLHLSHYMHWVQVALINFQWKAVVPWWN